MSAGTTTVLSISLSMAWGKATPSGRAGGVTPLAIRELGDQVCFGNVRQNLASGGRQRMENRVLVGGVVQNDDEVGVQQRFESHGSPLVRRKIAGASGDRESGAKPLLRRGIIDFESRERLT